MYTGVDLSIILGEIKIFLYQNIVLKNFAQLHVQTLVKVWAFLNY